MVESKSYRVRGCFIWDLGSHPIVINDQTSKFKNSKKSHDKFCSCSGSVKAIPIPMPIGETIQKTVMYNTAIRGRNCKHQSKFFNSAYRIRDLSLLTADLAHLRPRHPEMTHLCEAKARSKNHADDWCLATPRAIPIIT